MRIVVNGCFDLLHPGHIKLLEVARSYPNSYVLVLIDSDKRIKELKGHVRPIITELDRAYLINNLKLVDRVEIFDSDEELISLIRDYKPDIMVKGADYIGKRIIGEEFCKKIEFVKIDDRYSTSSLIKNIINR